MKHFDTLLNKVSLKSSHFRIVSWIVSKYTTLLTFELKMQKQDSLFWSREFNNYQLLAVQNFHTIEIEKKLQFKMKK